MSLEGQLSLNPKVLLLEVELKFLLVVLTSWFSGEGREWLHISFNIAILLAFVVLTLVTRPANRKWFDAFRGGKYGTVQLLCAALSANVCSAWA